MSSDKLASFIQQAGTVLVFTGAGISTTSGIPDFRGPQGLWRKWRPVYYQEFMTSHQARVEHWKFKLDGWRPFREAKPNAGHQALYALDRMGRLDTLVTQNIDGLHQLAGHAPEKVIELHGTNRLIECQSCRELGDPDPVYDEFERTQEPPVCRCGGFLKPATISFGQAMPEDKLMQSLAAAKRADLAIAIGSSLEVEPAASVPRIAKESGARLIIINQGETAQDALADLRLEGDAALILPETIIHLRTLIQSEVKG